MKHLEIEELRKYGERRLSAAAATRVILHLDGCGACFDRLRTMFPDFADRTRRVALEDLAAGETEDFHLDYEQHLRPFVDFETDEATREIVESHLAQCAFCARAVRELREFSDSLRLRETGKSHNAAAPIFDAAPDARPPRPAISRFALSVLFAALVLLFGTGGWLLLRQSPAAPDFVAENQTPPVPPLSSLPPNENLSNRQAEISANQALKKTGSSPQPDESAAAAKNKKPGVPTDDDRESEAAEMRRLAALLPSDFRARFQAAVQTRKLDLPAFLADLPQNGNRRGAAKSEKNALAPNAQAVREVRPLLKWSEFAVDGASYVVTVYDESFNQIVASSELKSAQWQLSAALERGRIYRWQVKAGNSAESYTAQFKVLGGKAIEKLKKIETAALRSPLALGIAYASEGLLDEAAREFNKEIEKKSRATLAVELKAALAAARK